MSKTPWTYRKVLAVSVSGLLLVGTGLWFAVMSNPRRYTSNVSNDRIIDAFAIGGFICTIAGAMLFLKAASQTTTSMSPHHRTNANLGMGIGFAVQLAGLMLPGTLQVYGLAGLVAFVASLPLFIWGATNYAQGKGHSKWFGLFGLAGILGFMALMVLPDNNEFSRKGSS